ncbi:DUF3953 domain-containing protein [Bacillus spongiae]|uniref:DUF3953 domain-containing protein n=1 Tax=Bacillus spongiae TaxID=2683610 RepID=A0ABU8HCS8_9BACI
MLKIVRIILAIIVITTTSYSLLTEEYWLQPYSLFLLGLLMFVMGLDEFKRGKRALGSFLFITSMFSFIVLFIT